MTKHIDEVMAGEVTDKRNGAHREDAEKPSIKKRKYSRGGCMECKRRKMKCDEGKPFCFNCTRLKKDCVYQHKQKFRFEAINGDEDKPKVAELAIPNNSSDISNESPPSNLQSIPNQSPVFLQNPKIALRYYNPIQNDSKMAQNESSVRLQSKSSPPPNVPYSPLTYPTQINMPQLSNPPSPKPLRETQSFSREANVQW